MYSASLQRDEQFAERNDWLNTRVIYRVGTQKYLDKEG
jgi:hypothetical protein